jgi:molybdenum cofactor biosynthesis protein MoaC
MIDVSDKTNTLRYAAASGRLYAPAEILARIKEDRIPKGDVLAVGRITGIAAAKRTPDTIVFCHPIPLDYADVKCTVESDHIRVVAEVRAIWKTGVEMEAINAVTAALLNIYDMLKPLDPRLKIGEIQLDKKTGGKSDFTRAPTRSLRIAIVVISDSAAAGKRSDRSGRAIESFLTARELPVEKYQIIADDSAEISAVLQSLTDREKMDLIFTTGGTGFGSRDVTPEATRRIIDREAPGIEECLRGYGQARTPYAMLSRGICGVRNKTVIINLPGSVNGVSQGLHALYPGLLHLFPMLWDEGH